MPGTGGPSLSRVAAPPRRASLPGRAPRLARCLPSQWPHLCVLVRHSASPGLLLGGWGAAPTRRHAPLGACSVSDSFSLLLCLTLCASLSGDSFLDVLSFP